ncbi:MAG TPA: VOC family protein [Kofleriaceae bacterium]|nr:VOC family protein [Kofleriaceae bacterium]
MLTIDHVAIPSRDPEAAARFFADLLDVPIGRDGADDEFPCVRLDARVHLLFTVAASEPPPAHHLALRASVEIFEAARARLVAAAIPFGNDPEGDGARNGQTEDFLGGHGRLYFHTADGHLFEICA